MFRIAITSLFIVMVITSTIFAAEPWTTLSNDFPVNDMTLDGDYLWIASGENVIRWDLRDDSYEMLNMGGSPPVNFAIQVAVGTDGIVWASLFGGDIKYYDGDTWQKADIDLGGENADRMVAGPDGSMWFSVFNGALYRHDGSELTEFTEIDGFSFERIGSMAAGDDGSMWCSSYGSGVARFKDNEWTTYAPPDTLGLTYITIDDKGSLWATGVDDFMCRLDGDDWVQYGEITEERLNEILLGSKTIEAKMILNQIINLEDAYNYNNSKYFEFNFGEDCPDISFAQPANANFEYSFNGETAIARELVDLNDDGDLNDGITMSTDKEFGAMEGSSYGGGSSATHGHAQNFISAPDGSFYSRTQNRMMKYNGSAWHYIENEGFPEGYVNAIAVSPDGRILVGGIDMLVSLDISTVGVDEDIATPSELTIHGNQPNPFNPVTTLQFTLPREGNVSAAVYSVSGQKIRTLHSGILPAGKQSLVWNGVDDGGNPLSSGVYIAKIMRGKTTQSHKMLLLR